MYYYFDSLMKDKTFVILPESARAQGEIQHETMKTEMFVYVLDTDHCDEE